MKISTVMNDDKSNKILFRPLSKTDRNSLYEIYSDKEAMKFRGSKAMENLADAERFIQEQELQKGKVLTIRKGVELTRERVLIGTVMYRFQEDRKEECEIGYSIGRQFWGKGYGKELVKMLLQRIQEKEDIETVIAWSNKENIASIKILEQHGFARVGQKESLDNYCYVKRKE